MFVVTNKLIHIVPFDIGCSFLNYDDIRQQSKKEFIDILSSKCHDEQIYINSTDNSMFMCVLQLNEQISCYLLDIGIGVFVLDGFFASDTEQVDKEFGNNIACNLYYRKKIEQRAILSQTEELKILYKFMSIIWSSVHKIERVLSASNTYKYGGFSYALSLYCIFDNEQKFNMSENQVIDLLLNPNILSKIEDSQEWTSIKMKVNTYSRKGYVYQMLDESTSVAASWSAVAVISEKESYSAIKKIVEYEIYLQASWFLFDCLIDNITRNKLSNLNLQRQKSLARNVSLEINNIFSANMHLSEKKVMESICETSGFSILGNKLFSLLENRIAIEEARLNERRGIYSKATEILLVLFTLISIYDPVKNLVSGTLDKTDMIVSCVMIFLFFICTVLIIRKE